MRRTRYAIVGTGARASMFIDPIAGRFAADTDLVGLCDSSITRRTYHQQRLIRDFGYRSVPTYASFDDMLTAQKPDVVIVCTPDCTHHEYIVKGLDYGADIISEKPLTTDAQKCQVIFDAIARTGRKVRTTFNLRWSPGVSKVRELIAQGSIGQIKHVDFEYTLNTSHGADYFRRWHSDKEFSGGLLIHKATHHFDLINWWIDGIPSFVFALGDLVFYGKKNAVARGDGHLTGYPRYTGFPESKADPFRFTVDDDPALSELYYQAEPESGYIRDQNVFREGITIEDSASLLVKYRTGVMLAYSLNAFSPIEGFRATISGDKGRIDYQEQHEAHIIVAGKTVKSSSHTMHLRLQELFSEQQDVPIAELEGGHGGGDPLIQEQIFSSDPPVDWLKRNAGHEQGAASLLVGAAANRSIANGQPVKINDLLCLNPRAKHLSELI